MNPDLSTDSAKAFPYKHWLMQHIYQRYEAKKLLTRKREDQKEAWRLHYEIGIANHNKLEDDLLFPSFTTEDSKRAVVQMTADHEKLLLAIGDSGCDSSCELAMYEHWRKPSRRNWKAVKTSQQNLPPGVQRTSSTR
eukprot:GEMP01076024.1.p1 GENE.GEMP01076024.1~~GEMP01076024.1.p1  ORF type:complete len:137 (-),score=24.60 GEMP01076024.1:422-832(-)